MVSCSKNEINAIREEGKDSVRVIAEYDDAGYDVQYVRDDVEAKMQTVAEEIHDELVIQGMGREYLEQLFEAGELHCSMHRFDEVTTFHFLDERFTGLFASVDSGADVRLATFADRCRELL